MTTTVPSTSKQCVWTEPRAKLDGASIITHLYNRLDGMYPNRWSASFSSPTAIEAWKAAWVEAFLEDGLTPQDVAQGLRACRKIYDWPPSLTEFIKACRPNIDPELAFHEAIRGMAQRQRGERGNWSHPAIYHAAVSIGAHDMLHGSYPAMKGRWNRVFADELAKGQWEPIPEARAALPAPRKTEQTDRAAQQAVEQLGIGGIGKGNGRDPLSWARAVVANPRGRTRTVIDMARRALHDGAEYA
ncbi:hypothetical protein ERD78_18770 [Allopusillimonas soli]|uniref:Replication protein n=1 Tax=Allopusillimonas soli TaxID=659016 RepID=A0A853FG88_9BURK|nr:replication protein P [Allopusillimonas soli]NYT38889.1 hypothetical protein [Allopusillimonas soli]TEA70112.1 hypothetical protein ERD78_18770 [Allopusillimonas soli]